MAIDENFLDQFMMRLDDVAKYGSMSKMFWLKELLGDRLLSCDFLPWCLSKEDAAEIMNRVGGWSDKYFNNILSPASSSDSRLPFHQGLCRSTHLGGSASKPY